MPIYEYVCERCGESLEAIHSFADPPPQECPKCGGKLRKKVSAPAFQFKGTGWYVTDYGARKGESAGKSSDSSESSESSSSSGGGDDSSAGPVKKAEPKAEPKSEPKTEPKSEPKTGTAGKSSKD